ncbi:nucleolar and coiled-body phosphoprotein 1-like isoform X3 [Portunus trituberculatus]|uniref:nucleolar and coiled-body phosphoprotein 1-like isoform X3 n=1 Tax=Portunus trituberculatus TaxID=210409 RepID=UPI001E1D1D41|nr:nucleolar and coiled-body phosphoprotein 1-like isoform X3 [Portunus trituberculatus]
MMLTLVLLVGAVSCSPVPSEPSLPASIARHGTSPAGAAHVEATHEARQVTFEVIDEVGETTLSTTSSDLSVEDDPPIPTATTPPVLPESEPQEANPAVTEPHHAQQQQRETNPYFSHGSPLVIQPHDPHDIHLHASLPLSQATSHHASQNSSSHASSFQHQTSNSEAVQPHTTSSGVKQNDTTPEVIHSHGANPETSLSHEKSSEDTLPHKLAEQNSESGNDKTSPQIVSSEEASTEKSVFSQKTPTSQSSEQEQVQSPEKYQPHETLVNGSSDESSQLMGDDGSKSQNSKNTSEVSHNVPHHHYDPEVESIVEADLHSWESSEHKHSSVSKDRVDTEDTGAGEDFADVGNQGIRNVVSRENNRTLPLREAVRETILVGHSLELAKDENSDTKDGKVEYIDTRALSTDTEEDTTDELTAEEQQQESNIQVSIAGESVQHPHEPAGSDDKPLEESGNTSQTHEVSDSQKKEEKSENIEESAGEVEVIPSLILDSLSPIDIVERSEGAEKEVLEGAASETVAETVLGETDLTPAETAVEEDARESRIYVKGTEDQAPDAASVEDQRDNVNHNVSKMTGGLESMSMTSPTPDTSLEEGRSSEDTEATIMPPETFEKNENTTAVETEGKIEGDEESPNPAPSVVPPPTEDYTDNYSDPISAESLPDELVTQEEIPSRERPQTDYPLLSTSDKEASGNLRTEGGVAWALPPQQEQVSAVAPDSLTPGCIVAIVFGVIISVTLLLGVGGFVVWQRRTLNRPKVLGSDRGYAGSDSGGYIDDQVRVSYVNSQIDSPKGTGGQASQSAQGEQVPQVLIHLRSLKPSLPKGLGKSFQKALPSMPKVAPMNLPNIGQFIPKRESRGSNQSGQ